MIDNVRGKGLIRIKTGNEGHYLFIQRPVSLVWPDRMGSIAKYFCVLPYDESYRELIRKNLIMNLNLDYTDNQEKLIENFEPLLELFDTGKFQINYYKDTYFKSWDIAFNSLLYTTNKIVFKESKKFEHLVKKPSNTNTTESYYDASCDYLVFTEPMENIDLECVERYKCEIEKGERPGAVIFKQGFDKVEQNPDGTKSFESFHSPYFIIDGHHKLIAYHQLKIRPAIVLITRVLNSEEEFNFNINDLSNYLFLYQINHIMDR